MPAILIDPATGIPADPVMGIVFHEPCSLFGIICSRSISSKGEHDPAAPIGEGAGSAVTEVLIRYLQIMVAKELDEYFLDG